jgi:hypothetical protein
VYHENWPDIAIQLFVIDNTKNYNSGTVMGRFTLVLNRQTLTLSILTKSQTFNFDLIDDKQLNGNVWPVFMIHAIVTLVPTYCPHIFFLIEIIFNEGVQRKSKFKYQILFYLAIVDVKVVPLMS